MEFGQRQDGLVVIRSIRSFKVHRLSATDVTIVPFRRRCDYAICRDTKAVTVINIESFFTRYY